MRAKIIEIEHCALSSPLRRNLYHWWWPKAFHYAARWISLITCVVPPKVDLNIFNYCQTRKTFWHSINVFELYIIKHIDRQGHPTPQNQIQHFDIKILVSPITVCKKNNHWYVVNFTKKENNSPKTQTLKKSQQSLSTLGTTTSTHSAAAATVWKVCRCARRLMCSWCLSPVGLRRLIEYKSPGRRPGPPPAWLPRPWSSTSQSRRASAAAATNYK